MGGFGEPAFGELPVARQPRARWPLPKPVLDFVEGNRAVLVHVALGDGVGDTLVTQDISEPVEERWRVVVSNGGARAVRSASRAEICEREKRRANRSQLTDVPESWSITLHGLGAGVAHRKRYQPWVAARQ